MKRIPSGAKSRRFCSVPQCNSYCVSNVSLHRFPLTNEKLCNAWKEALQIGKPISKYMSVCSLHFKPNDFFLLTPLSKRARLKRGVVPSQKLPKDSHLETRGNKNTKCDECLKEFKKITHLTIHKMRAHAIPKNCPILSKTFVATSEMDPLFLPNKKLLFKCDKCYKKYSQSCCLGKHIRNAHGSNKEVVCSECGKRLSSERNLKRHLLAIHAKPEQRNFECEICWEKYPTKEMLIYHVADHIEECNFKCDQCDKSFLRKRNFVDHKKSNTCPVCSKQFKSKHTLTFHLKLHKHKNFYRCDECPKKFRMLNTVKVHKKKQHGKIFFCTCKASFKSTRQLKLHKKRTEPFVCKVCNVGFPQDCCAPEHYWTHGIDKSFQCDFCEKKFHLKRHLKCHLSACIVKKQAILVKREEDLDSGKSEEAIEDLDKKHVFEYLENPVESNFGKTDWKSSENYNVHGNCYSSVDNQQEESDEDVKDNIDLIYNEIKKEID